MYANTTVSRANKNLRRVAAALALTAGSVGLFSSAASATTVRADIGYTVAHWDGYRGTVADRVSDCAADGECMRVDAPGHASLGSCSGSGNRGQEHSIGRNTAQNQTPYVCSSRTPVQECRSMPPAARINSRAWMRFR